MPAVIDTHAHVFLRDHPMAADRRYAPDYDATPEDYLAVLDQHGVAAGVLIQPSFYGTDNKYLLKCLKRAPERLRGVAVLDPITPFSTLLEINADGVVGIRFNLIGSDPDILYHPGILSLCTDVAKLGWHIEVQAAGNMWASVLRALAEIAAPIVVDHFGRPDPASGVACPGFQEILRVGKSREIYVKLSASYRCGGGNARAYTAALLDHLGPDRLLWGSDWPWTQHEAGRSYAALVAETSDSTLPPLSVLCAPTAQRLFRFG